MPDDNLGEKIYPPTPRRLEEAQNRGQVARSLYLNTGVILLVSTLALHFYIPRLSEAFQGLFIHSFSSIGNSAFLEDIPGQSTVLAWRGTMEFGKILLPFLSLLLGAAILVNMMQVGVRFSLAPLEFQWDRLDPIQGVVRLFSSRNVIRLGLGLLKLFIVFAVLFYFLYSQQGPILHSYHSSIDQFLSELFTLSYRLVLMSTLLVIGLALLDFLYQRWRYQQDLFMTRTEFLEEMRHYEGDPKLKERRRIFYRQVLIQKMLQKVPEATAVVANPIHVAVAIRYTLKMGAPKVIAKGKGLLAHRIKQIAAEHGIPVFERPPLARLLYNVEIDQEIPPDLYRAVIEILKFVYREKPELLAAEPVN